MTKLRALRVASQRQLPNFLLMSGPEAARAAGLVPVLFPVLLGMNRYRVCFVSRAVRAQVRRIVSFRGGVAGLVVPAWLPFQSMRDLVDAAREVQAPVADPLESVPKSF